MTEWLTVDKLALCGGFLLFFFGLPPSSPFVQYPKADKRGTALPESFSFAFVVFETLLSLSCKIEFL